LGEFDCEVGVEYEFCAFPLFLDCRYFVLRVWVGEMMGLLRTRCLLVGVSIS
jgi:hypothetical protein